MNQEIDPPKTYSAGLKLATVLEFISNPKRREAICKKYGATENILDEWH